MHREQLEHMLRACAAITKCREFVVIRSQSVLGAHPDAPDDLKVSREVDIYPLDLPELADLIDGSIGEGLPFEETFGYYAQGVGPDTAVLPQRWQHRLIKIESPATGGAVGYCLEPHDLAISKYVANREKDRAFNAAMIRHGFVEQEELNRRAELLDDHALAQRVKQYIARDFALRS